MKTFLEWATNAAPKGTPQNKVQRFVCNMEQEFNLVNDHDWLDHLGGIAKRLTEEFY